jgi:hypothetical protein
MEGSQNRKQVDASAAVCFLHKWPAVFRSLYIFVAILDLVVVFVKRAVARTPFTIGVATRMVAFDPFSGMSRIDTSGKHW